MNPRCNARPKMLFAVCSLWLLTGPAGCSGGGRSEDLVVTNARIWTGDPEQPEASVLVVHDGEFVYVGDELPEKYQSPKRRQVIDAGGARIIPGLIDSHLHLVSGGLHLTRLNLRDVPGRDAFIQKVAHRAAATPPGRWILGGRWSTESWPDPTQPDKSWIDAVTADRPALLHRMDGHGALANSAALKRAGISRDGPPDPPGGLIERDPATREPTGILKESAIGLVARLIPAPSAGELDTALAAAMHHANARGITTVHTMSPWSDLAVLERARDAGGMTLRVRVYVSEDDWRPLVGKVRRRWRGGDWLRVCGFKQFMDGSLGSRTAYMAEPFADEPDNRGVLREVMYAGGGDRPDPAHLAAMCRAAVKAHLSPAIHAIGDQANHLVLNVYQSLIDGGDVDRDGDNKNAAGGESGAAGNVGAGDEDGDSGASHESDDWLPLRIEHAQHLLPGDIARFARLGVVASMQPLHKADDGRYAERAIGPSRCRTSYAFRSLLDAGATVAFGSDWPVVSLDPFEGMAAATTGRTLDGKVFVPEQNITAAEALLAYTAGGAAATAESGRLGVIRAGALADFVILDGDPLTAPTGDNGEREVFARQTFINGRLVYTRSDR